VFAGWIATTMLYYGLSLNASNLGNKYQTSYPSFSNKNWNFQFFYKDVVVQIAFFNCYILARPFFPEKYFLKLDQRLEHLNNIFIKALNWKCNLINRVLGSIPASSGIVKSEGRQIKQCWFKLHKTNSHWYGSPECGFGWTSKRIDKMNFF
jgi:hypothetical protein